MKVLLVYPGSLMYSELYLRLEPLGLERIAQSLLSSGHQVRLIDLQIFSHADLFRELDEFKPENIGFCLNYMAHLPEVIDLAIEIRRRRPESFIFVGGHIASFIPKDVLRHSGKAIDCIVRGEGEAITPRLVEAGPDGQFEGLPGVVTAETEGPLPELIASLDGCIPARHLTRKRNRYFIGSLDPCASLEFTRGCPWNCSFCSAWTFYSRSYRKASPEAVAEDLMRIREPNVFVVDDVVFIRAEDGYAIAREVERRNIRKRYYMETRCDVLIRNQEVFAYWKQLGLKYLFLGVEAIDEEDLKSFRKGITLKKNFEALEIARKLGVTVAMNIIVDTDWDENRFRAVREWARSVPEIVNLTVMTPYPGTEKWYSGAYSLTTGDYRLFDIQHAVTPTGLPLKRFYEELIRTQAIVNQKHMSFSGMRKALTEIVKLLSKGQTNFFKMLWKFKKVYDPDRLYADHFREVKYALYPPAPGDSKPASEDLYIHVQPNDNEAFARGTTSNEII